ncbi:hypothetical protein [Paenibacillus marinisediminis]
MSLFSKSCLLILVITALFLLSSCSGQSKEDVMKELVPTEEKYAIHLFHKNGVPESETMELLNFLNSNSASTNAIRKVQFWDQSQERNIKWAKALEIKEFPMYLVIDANGIVLETPFLSHVKEFLSKSLLSK